MDLQACAQESTDGFVGVMERGIGGKDIGRRMEDGNAVKDKDRSGRGDRNYITKETAGQSTFYDGKRGDWQI